jgi:hypothetical protein
VCGVFRVVTAIVSSGDKVAWEVENKPVSSGAGGDEHGTEDGDEDHDVGTVAAVMDEALFLDDVSDDELPGDDDEEDEVD